MCCNEAFDQHPFLVSFIVENLVQSISKTAAKASGIVSVTRGVRDRGGRLTQQSMGSDPFVVGVGHYWGKHRTPEPNTGPVPAKNACIHLVLTALVHLLLPPPYLCTEKGGEDIAKGAWEKYFSHFPSTVPNWNHSRCTIAPLLQRKV